MSENDDKPPHVEAVRKRLEEAAKDRPEPRFGAKRKTKPRRRPATADIPDRLRFPFAGERDA